MGVKEGQRLRGPSGWSLRDAGAKSDSPISCQQTRGPLLIHTQVNSLKLLPWNISSHFCFLTLLLSILELVHVNNFALYSPQIFELLLNFILPHLSILFSICWHLIYGQYPDARAANSSTAFFCKTFISI